MKCFLGSTNLIFFTCTIGLTALGVKSQAPKTGNVDGGVLVSHKALDLLSFYSAAVFFVYQTTAALRLKRP